MLDYRACVGSEEILDLFVLEGLKLGRALAARYHRKFRVSTVRTMICAETMSWDTPVCCILFFCLLIFTSQSEILESSALYIGIFFRHKKKILERRCENRIIKTNLLRRFSMWHVWWKTFPDWGRDIKRAHRVPIKRYLYTVNNTNRVYHIIFHIYTYVCYFSYYRIFILTILLVTKEKKTFDVKNITSMISELHFTLFIDTSA